VNSVVVAMTGMWSALLDNEALAVIIRGPSQSCTQSL
jgi:hypothetical protein